MAGLPKTAFPDLGRNLGHKDIEAERSQPDFDKSKSLDELQAFVTGGNVRAATALDEIERVQPALVIEPADEAEVAKVLSFANSAGLAVAPRGHGTKMNWGPAPSRADVVVSVTRLNRVLEHANQDMTVTVEAGVTIGELQRRLAQKGQRLALDPLWPEQATVGGVIATNDSGSLRIRFGGVRDLIIGVTIVLPNGTVAMSGGKVVKNVAGYDLQKLMTGAFGTLGVISKAVFRLHPLPEQRRTLTFSFRSTEDANKFMLAIADSTLVPTGVQMRLSNVDENQGAKGDPSADFTRPGAEVDVRLEGVTAGVEAQTRQACAIVAKRSMKVIQTETTGESHYRTESGNEPRDDVWLARERLWQDREPALILKLSTLPSDLSSTAEFVRQHCPGEASWSMVAQSVGLATLRLELHSEAMQTEGKFVEFVSRLRAQLSKRGGRAVALHVPRELKPRIDVWGSSGTAQPLMTRIKQQFDPAGTLNRGRFVGGI
jgi:glycolate oxidase FAD binding subunit